MHITVLIPTCRSIIFMWNVFYNFFYNNHYYYKESTAYEVLFKNAIERSNFGM